MHICLNKGSALALLRSLRAEEGSPDWTVCGVPDADPWPQKRWSRRIVPYLQLGRSEPPSRSNPIEVIVPEVSAEPRASFFSVRTCDGNLPPGSFLRVTSEYTIPCPELLFLELSEAMDRAALELVGYELCGSYARNAADPRTGGVTHGIEPVTSVRKIESYLDRCPGRRGLAAARAALRNVRDNAWSAMEAVVSLMLVREVEDLGYGISEVTLNEREDFARELRGRSSAAVRIPDISLNDLPIGFNYDGYGHLGLGSADVSSLGEIGLGAMLAAMREKYVDDIRRNRELLAHGRIVLPVVAEDLVERGGLDAVVLEAVLAAEHLVGSSGDVGARVRRALANDRPARRQQLIWSIYPWHAGPSLGAY